MRFSFIAAGAFAAVFAAFAADDPATTLARILAQKGAINSTELARVEAAGPAGKVEVLTALLAEKGLLTPSDMSRLAANTPPPPGQPVPGRMVSASTQPPPSAPPKPETPSPPVTSESKFPVTVYGTLLMNAFSDTSLNNNQDIPLVNGKQGSDPLGNDKSFGMTARQSRIGLRYTGPQLAGARISGQAEIDFLGGKAAFVNGISFDLVRLRLAFGRLDWNNVAFEAGQDWSVFAPLNPTSLAEYAIPALSASGNPWIRTPQIRVELNKDVSDTTRIRFQIAAVDPDVGDYNTAVFLSTRTPGIGERGRYPAVDSRLGLTTKADDREFAFGVSSHYGRGKNAGTIGTGTTTFQVGVDSWGVAIDYSLPFSKLFTFSGEWFVGRALGIFSDSLSESVLPVGTPGQHGVESRGGWSQAQFNFTPKWQINLAYGIDAEQNRNVRTGDRNKNQTYLGNVIYKYNPRVNFALEWRRFLTNFKNQRFADETGDHFNLAVAYFF